MEIFLGFLLILIILTAFGSIFLLFKEAQKRPVKNSKQRSSRSQQIKSVPGNLQKKLLRLLLGDKKTADRLINGLRLKYPGEQERWYWEKAIFDLERDRH